MSDAAIENVRKQLEELEQKEREMTKAQLEERERNEKEHDRLVVEGRSVREKLDKLKGELHDVKLKYDTLAIEYAGGLLEAETVCIEHERVAGYLGRSWGGHWILREGYGFVGCINSGNETHPLPEDLTPITKGGALWDGIKAKRAKGKK